MEAGKDAKKGSRPPETRQKQQSVKTKRGKPGRRNKTEKAKLEKQSKKLRRTMCASALSCIMPLVAHTYSVHSIHICEDTRLPVKARERPVKAKRKLMHRWLKVLPANAANTHTHTHKYGSLTV